MKPEIKEKITATNQKYLKKFLTEEAPAKLESQLEHMDWSYLDMIHNKEQQRGDIFTACCYGAFRDRGK